MATVEQIVSIDKKLLCCNQPATTPCEQEILDCYGLDLDTIEGQWQAAYNIVYSRVNGIGCAAADQLQCLVDKALLCDDVVIEEKPLDAVNSGFLVGFSTRWGY